MFSYVFMVFPHIFVWGSSFWVCTPVRRRLLPPPSHTQLAHTHTQLTHTQLTRTPLTHTQLTPTPLTHTPLTYLHTTYTPESQEVKYSAFNLSLAVAKCPALLWKAQKKV